MGLIDTHTHLDGFARRGELPAILARAREAGLEAMVTIGTDADDWTLYRDLAAAHPGEIHYSAGLHPCSVDEKWAERFAQLEGFWSGAENAGTGGQAPRPGKTAELPHHPVGAVVSHGPSSHPKPVALGEVGLDRFHLPKDDPAAAERIFGWQREAFAAGLALARRLGCPVVVHSRGAFRECVGMIDASGVEWGKVVFHCFTDGPAEMAEITRRGGYGSFTGIITYKTAGNLREAALAQGLDRLMLETDAPYLTPVPHRGKPNEPAYLRHTAGFCADLFGVPLAKLTEVSSANAKRFYSL